MNVDARLRAWPAQLQVLLWRHGWSWPLAVLVAAGGMALWLGWLQPTQDALQAVQQALAQPVAAPAAPAPSPQLREGEHLQALQDALKRSADAPELVRSLDQLAQAQQIAWSQGEYQTQMHASTGLLQVQVTQPVRAGYPQLRRYIESVLRAHPNASLDQVNARRDNVGQAQLDARLRWSFWVHTGGSKP